jgi:hypothetical protein
VPQSPITHAEFMAKAFQILVVRSSSYLNYASCKSGMPLISSSENPQDDL